jgi:hypothetical protein
MGEESEKPKPSFLNDVVNKERQARNIPPLTGQEGLGDFDYEGAPAGKQEDNKQYLNGDFKLSPQMKSNMVHFGQDFLDAAAKHHVDVAQTREFSKVAHKGRDGKMHISAAEVGAAALASTMTTEAEDHIQFTDSGLRNDPEVKSQFHNKVTVKGLDKLAKEDAKLAVEIARQLLHDNGLVPKDIDPNSHQDALPDPQFTNMARSDPDTTKYRR